MTKKERIYDKLYQAGQKLFDHHDPCKFVNGKCSKGQHCCSRCKYLKKKGCTVKALYCKLWLCYYEKDPQLYDRLAFLRHIKHNANIVFIARASKKETLGL